MSRFRNFLMAIIDRPVRVCGFCTTEIVWDYSVVVEIGRLHVPMYICERCCEDVQRGFECKATEWRVGSGYMYRLSYGLDWFHERDIRTVAEFDPLGDVSIESLMTVEDWSPDDILKHEG